MKIGEAIKELPDTARRVSRHGALWLAVERAAGDWIPVTCQSAKERKGLQSAAGAFSRWGKRPRMQTVSDVASLTLYIHTVDGRKA